MKSNVFRFMEGQTHFSTAWHAKVSLSLNKPIENDFAQTPRLPLILHQKLAEFGRHYMQNNQLLTNSHVELMDTLMMWKASKLEQSHLTYCHWHVGGVSCRNGWATSGCSSCTGGFSSTYTEGCWQSPCSRQRHHFGGPTNC